MSVCGGGGWRLAVGWSGGGFIGERGGEGRAGREEGRAVAREQKAARNTSLQRKEKPSMFMRLRLC